MNILVLSNGKGEDSIAATVVVKLQNIIKTTRPDSHPHIELSALPLVGHGSVYSKIGVKVISNNPVLPSGGFGLNQFKVLFQDLKAGLLSSHLTNLKVLKAANPDLILAFGDIFPVLLGLLTKKPVIHIATAYSVYLHPLHHIDKLLLKKCLKVISRDSATATHLKSQGIPAIHHGNPMMDDPQLSTSEGEGGVPPVHSPQSPATTIGLIPSSRPDAYDNLKIMCQIINNIPNKQDFSFVASIAPTLDLKLIETIIKPYKKEVSIQIDNESTLGSVIIESELVIGMTGTGNEQAAGLGTPLVLLKGLGTHSTNDRLKHYKRLLGDAVFIPSGDKQAIASQISELLNDQAKLDQMSAAGRERMGQPGGAELIAHAIFSEASNL